MIAGYPAGPVYPGNTASPRNVDAAGRPVDGSGGVRDLDRCSGWPRLWSRNHKPVDSTYPEVLDALAAHALPQFVVDGEVVAFDGEHTSFGQLQRRMHVTDSRAARAIPVPVFYYVFDLISFGGVDLTGVPLRLRKHLLASCFDFTGPLRLSEAWPGDRAPTLREACEQGWEGLIAKRAEGRYQPGRTSDWLKLKCVAEEEFVVGGFTEPRGGRTGFGSLLLGYYDQYRAFRYAGKVGTGYDEHTLRAIHARLEASRQEHGPFTDPVPELNVNWVSPELVVQVGYTDWTRDGRLRHPRFRGVRTDRPPSQVVRGMPRPAGQ